MAGHSNSFPWPPYYGHFKFFETRMRQHGRVAELKHLEFGLYEIALASGSALRTFICECYSYGAAEYVETVEKMGRLDIIVINSAWCAYTTEAKIMCRGEKVGLFQIRDLMAALHKPEIWSYLNEEDEERFAENGWA